MVIICTNVSELSVGKREFVFVWNEGLAEVSADLIF